MTPTTFNGDDVYVLDLEPDWENGVEAEVSLVAQLDRGLSNREGRRAFSETLRLRTRYRIRASGTDGRRLAAGLREQTIEPVLAPLWPARTKWSERAARAIAGGLNFVFKANFSAWAIWATGDPDPGFVEDGDFITPLLWGRLERRRLNWLSPDLAELEVEHVEDGIVDYAVMPAAVTFAAGPNPGGYGTTPRLLPFEVNFDSRPDEFTVSVLREQVGFGRGPALTFYPQAVAREQESGHFLQSQAAAGQMLEFFRQHGAGKAFWAPNWVSAAVLTADVAPAQTVLNVEDTVALEIGDYVAFVKGDGSVVTAVVAGTSSTTVTVSPAPGALSAGSTVVSGLLLAAFKKPALAVQWRCNDYAQARLPLREVPAEYAAAADETLGTTLGSLAERCFLYELTRTLDGTDFVERWTSYEQDLTWSGNTYSAQKVTHGEIKQGLYLDRDEVELKSDVFTDNVLMAVATLKSEARMFLAVRQAEVSGGAPASVGLIFTGEVANVSVKGSRVTAKAVSGNTLFERPVPRFLVQRGCNHGLFTPGCGLAVADWTFTAKIAGVGSPGYPFEFDLSNLARVTGADPPTGGYAANWFAGGWMELNAGGADFQRRAIVLSTNPSGGALTVTLDRDPDPFPAVNDDVKIFPGCDLAYTTCAGKFGNALNFGGHPFLPLANPSFVKPRQSGPSSKK